MTCHVDVDAPKEGRDHAGQFDPSAAQTRQCRRARRILRGASSGCRRRRTPTEVRKDPKLLAPDPNDIRSFRVALQTPPGAKRGRGGTFIDSVLDTLDTFYGEVVQHIEPVGRTASAETSAKPTEVKTSRPNLISTDLSSETAQDWPPDAAE